MQLHAKTWETFCNKVSQTYEAFGKRLQTKSIKTLPNTHYLSIQIHVTPQILNSNIVVQLWWIPRIENEPRKQRQSSKMQQRNPTKTSFRAIGVLFLLMQIVTMDSQYCSNSSFIMFLTGTWTTQSKQQMRTGHNKSDKLMKLWNLNNFQSQTQPMWLGYLLRLDQKIKERKGSVYIAVISQSNRNKIQPSSNAETNRKLKVLDGALQEQARFGLRKCKWSARK